MAYSARFADASAVETYDREFERGYLANVSELERQAVRGALESRRQRPFHRHLDFACGTGRAIGFVDGYAEATIGVDVSEAMLERARERHPHVRFIRADAVDEPEVLKKLGPFDLVTVWRFIAPAEPELRIAALRAVSQSMNEGGLLLVNNNANRTSLHWVGLFLRSLVKRERFRSGLYHTSLPHRELCGLLRATGFQVEDTRAVCYLPEHLARRVPARLWVRLERALDRINMAPSYSANQLVIARRAGRTDRARSAVARVPGTLAP